MASGTLENLALELALALQPLEEQLRAAEIRELFAELGLEFPPSLEAQAGFVSALEVAAVSAARMGPLALQIVSAIEADNSVNLVKAALEVVDVLGTLVPAFETIGTELRSLSGVFPEIDPADIDAFASELPRRLLEYALVSYLEGYYPILLRTFTLLGVVELNNVSGDADNPAKPSHTQRKLRLERLTQFFSSPENAFRNLYGWSDAAFDGRLLLEHLYYLLSSLSIPTSFAPAETPPTLRTFLFRISPRTDLNPRGLEVFLEVSLPNGMTASLPMFDPEWILEYKIGAQLDSGTGITIQPPVNVAVIPPNGSLQGDLSIGVVRAPKPGRSSIVLVGVPGGSGLQAQRVSVNLISSVVWDSSTPQARGDFGFVGEIRGGKLIITTEGADGFLGKILPDGSVTADFDFALGWTAERGFFFRGSSGLEVRLATHIDLGPVSLEAITLGVGIENRKIPVSVGADIKAKLGPLVAVVENMGLTATFSFPPDNRGNLGPLQFDLGFMPPKGVGLSLDAGGFKGGGFLRLDSEKGEYVGALELDFNGLFSVKAIGIINTKMPDGKKGFSLLIVISAEFTPIQLSFGFTLNGVGGIFGLNRMIVVAALAEGIRTNAVKSILFPENVIANITRIISDIKQFFPPKQDHFVVGPMAKLGWGTPSIITVELGLLLDLPDPMFAIVGVLKAVLPEEKAPILRLQVNFLGVVDFGRGYIFFRADLFDSRLLVYSITGSMAFLVSWGEAQTFALSVGGFHPDFRDIPTIPALPDGFRSMRRIGISLLSDDNPRLKIESYFAVTSNTVQFGARIELYAEAGGFNIYGFLGFDVLFQFDPFRFVAKLSGGVALRRHSSVIAGVTINATLSGPTPWDARGKATLSFLFFSISVGFHTTWGDPPPAITSATEDLLKLLQREFADTRNWRADLPPNNHLHVSLRKIELPAGTEMLVIHPAGVLTFSQRSLPLEDFVIQKFGNKKPLAENKFKITNANSDNAVIPADYQGVREQFAPGNFLELSDSEKLSRKSFDNLPSGFKLTATSDLLATLPVVRDVEYELSYLRRERIVPKGLIKLFVLAYDKLVKGSAVRQSRLAQQQTRVSLNAPPQVGLPRETFAIANAADLKSHVTNASGPVVFATQAEAYQQQQELIAQNPALAGQIQVVSHFELNLN